MRLARTIRLSLLFMAAGWFCRVSELRADDRSRAEPGRDLSGWEAVQMPRQPAGFIPGPLASVIGDTIFVGTTAWDDQHNACAARQIVYQPGGNWQALLVWTKLSGGEPGSPRHIRATRVADDGLGGLYISPDPAIQVDDVYRSGYTGLAYASEINRGIPGFHCAETEGSEYASVAALSGQNNPALFNLFGFPEVFEQPHLWPRVAYGSDGYVHMIAHGQRALINDPVPVSYMRWHLDEPTFTLIPATPDGLPLLMTGMGMNISGDIAVSDDGTKVGIAACVTRHLTIGEIWGGLPATQVDNDIYLYISNDSGQSWDPEHPRNITGFIGPTGGSAGDTMRAYADVSLEWDMQGSIRAAFTAAEGNALSGLTYNESRIYSYLRDGAGNDWWTLIHFQPDPGYPPEIWGRTVDRPCLYFDPNTLILWCLFRAFGGGEHDYGADSGIGNGDLYLSASPPGRYNGLLWAKPVNITKTNWTTPGGAPLGESRSETDGTLALNSHGDYLHIGYLLDLDAGTGVANPPQGLITSNPYVYQRVSKQEILQRFEITRQWVVNYPLHVDSSGFWQDPGNWEWESYGGFFTGSRETVQGTLNLEILDYSIPPNGGTGTYTVQLINSTPTEFTDVTYWTLITDPLGVVHGPLTQMVFTLHPNQTIGPMEMSQYFPPNAPGGSYYLTGFVGFYPASYLSDAVQFFKFGEAAGGEGPDLGDPSSWPSSGGFGICSTPGGAGSERVKDIEISAASPNPFNPETTISVRLQVGAALTVAVYNIEGRQVATLAQGWSGAGEHRFTFDGSEFASGVYFIRAASGGGWSQLRKVTLLK